MTAGESRHSKCGTWPSASSSPCLCNHDYVCGHNRALLRIGGLKSEAGPVPLESDLTLLRLLMIIPLKGAAWCSVGVA